MILTPEGLALFRYCQGARELEGHTLAQISGAALETEVRVCLTGSTSLMRSRLVPQCFSVAEKFPRLLLTFDIDDTSARAEKLRTGAAQICVLPPEEVGKELSSKMLRTEKYILMGPRAWKNRPLKDILKKRAYR